MDPILDVVVVDIDVFGALVVTSFDKLKRGLVVAVELDGIDVVADVADLLEEAGEPCSLIGGVRESDLPSCSCRGRDKLLVVRAVTDSTASKFEEIALRRLTVLSVRK
jgi:thiamine monophosphate synthase